MKETKSFFTKNNNLNKVGVVPKTQASKEVPFAKDLAEYEALYPGSTKKILDMARSEQENDHLIAKMEIEMAKRARRMGAFSAILVMIAICYFAYNLIIANYMLEGLVFAGIGFAFLLISGCKYNKSNMRHCSSNNKISTTEEQSQETQVKKYHQKRRFYKNKR